MKKFIIIAIVALLTIGCQFDEYQSKKIVDTTLLTVNIMPTANYIYTKGVSSDKEENTILNAYIFVFDSNGQKVFNKFVDGLNSVTSTSLEMTSVPSGQNMSIAIISNIGNSNTLIDINSNVLDNINSKNDLITYTTTMKTTAIERGSSFLMSGLKENITIRANQNNNIEVTLKRVDAKISFIVNPKKDVKFTPLDWRVVSIPKKVNVLNNGTIDQFNYEHNYFTSDWKSFDVINKNDTSIFSFYMFENKVSAKQLIGSSGDYNKDYALREKQIKTPNSDGSVTNGDFVYAKKAASYIEIRGNVWYKVNGTEISADVIFTIHLGGINNNVNDYNILRNTYYKYYVKILSVNSIIVEVNSLSPDDEPRPGSEGDVVIANVIKELDAHNEIFTFNFHQSTIDSTLTWNVSTPFSTTASSTEAKDYNWVHFSLCDLVNNTYSTNYKKYLGDSNVYSNSEFNNSAYNHPLDMYMAQIANGTNKMLNIKQLVEILKESNARYIKNQNEGTSYKHLYDNTQSTRFTVFVNEYYYNTNPNNPNETVENGLWKQFVNQKKRVMNIISLYKQSYDRESSTSKALYSIRQASIQTMYNKNSTNNFTAWGSQMVQDTTLTVFDKITYTSPTPPEYSDINNGRYNSSKMWITQSINQWGTYINSDTWKMRNTYETAKYKCMRLNRDMNGDGKIQEKEIQWYLASINQLTDIWLGEFSYDENAKLYKYNTWEINKQWYASSTVRVKTKISNKYKEDPDILWASEGSSIGILSNYTNGINSLVYYRCVRNLGLPKDADITVVPDHFATYNSEDNTISLEKLDNRSIRGFSTIMELQNHTERDLRGYNKPWRKFEINPNCFGKDLTWTDVKNKSQPNGSDPLCPAGWRVPNQREMALMYSLMPKDTITWPLDNHMCRTGFTWSTANRPGFAVSKGGFTLFLINNLNMDKGGTRCIRDVID